MRVLYFQGYYGKDGSGYFQSYRIIASLCSIPTACELTGRLTINMVKNDG
jgi:hypothetical protein